MKVQVIASGVVTNVLAFDACLVASDGSTVVLPDGSIIPAPSDSIFMMQEGAGIGWLLSGGSLSAPVIAEPELTKEQLREYAAAKRWSKETSGITLSGIVIATDDRSKQMIMGARIAASSNDAFTTPWVGADGVIVKLTAQEVIAISDAVLAHVQSCFATFADLVISIGNGEVATTSQIDEAFAS